MANSKINTEQAILSEFNKKADLDPELEGYLCEGGITGTMLKHPLVFEVLYSPQFNNICNIRLKEKKNLLKRALEKNNYSTFVFAHERPYRLWAFEQIHKKVSDQEYWDLLGSIWIDSENIWETRLSWYQYLFFAERKGKHMFMAEEDRAFFEALPERFEIYRGCSKRSEDGLSWTVDRKIAEFFTKRHRGGYVISKTVNKKDCFAYTNQREEKEIIYFED